MKERHLDEYLHAQLTSKPQKPQRICFNILFIYIYSALEPI